MKESMRGYTKRKRERESQGNKQERLFVLTNLKKPTVEAEGAREEPEKVPRQVTRYY